MTLSKQALALITLMAVAALAAIVYATQTGQPMHGYGFLALLAGAAATARLKVKLPGMTGCMSVCLPFLLMAASQLSMIEALLVALPACAVQCLPKGGGKPKLVQMLFNMSTMAVAVAAASLIGTHFAAVLGAAGFFVAQTVPVAGIIHLTEGGAVHRIWSSIAHQTFPFYVLSAGITSMATSSTVPQSSGWQVALLCLPVMYAIYRSYESYFREPALAGK